MIRATDRLRRAWTRRGPLASLLWPLSLVFGALVALRRELYRHGILQSAHPGRPVVVIGNLIVGGAGKTPLVIALVNALRARGLTPGIVSRGYGGSASRQDSAERADARDARRFGDEVVLIAGRTGAPVYVGRDRGAAALALVGECPEVDVILSDDGLQHYGLARDVDIAVFDARGLGNGWMLPAGPLREPPSRVKHLDAMVINGAPGSMKGSMKGSLKGTLDDGPPAFAMRVAGSRALRLHKPAESRPLAAFRGMSLLAVAGIGQPERFFDMLAAAGLCFARLALPDHHDFRATRFDSHAADAILMTEKDAVKCSHLDDARLWFVPVDAAIDAGLVELILEKLRGSAPA